MLGPDAEEPLLSDEETNALLDAMREEESSGEVEVVTTDLGSPEGPMREALARADAAAALIGTAARTQILIQTARGIEVELLPAEIVPRDVLMSSLDPRAMTYQLSHRGSAQGVLSIDSALARYVLDRAMGSVEADPPGGMPRAFTELDRRVLDPFPRAIVRSLGQSFLEGRLLGFAPHSDAEEVSGASRFEPMLRLGLRFATTEGRAGELVLALNAAAVAASASGGEEETRPRAGNTKSSLASGLLGADVDLVAVLGRAPSSVRQLLELQVGDVFRLDGSPNEALSLCIGDVTVARGAPLVVSGDLAVEISEAYGRAPHAASSEAA